MLSRMWRSIDLIPFGLFIDKVEAKKHTVMRTPCVAHFLRKEVLSELQLKSVEPPILDVYSFICEKVCTSGDYISIQ